MFMVIIIIGVVFFAIYYFNKSNKEQELSAYEEQLAYMFNYIMDVTLTLSRVVNNPSSKKYFTDFKELIIDNEKALFAIEEQLKMVKNYTKNKEEYQEVIDWSSDIKSLNAAASASESSKELLSNLKSLKSSFELALQGRVTEEEIEKTRVFLLDGAKQTAANIRRSF